MVLLLVCSFWSPASNHQLPRGRNAAQLVMAFKMLLLRWDHHFL
jgi:hypothetical protein